MKYPPTCTCNTQPCYCQEEYDDSELATCPECGGKAPWPDSWEVGGIGLEEDDDGTTYETEPCDGRVFCPSCGEIVVPILPEEETPVTQQTMFGG